MSCYSTSSHETIPDPVYDSSRPIPALKPLYQFPLANVPGKTITALLVTFPPNGSTPPHRHGQASLTGYVVEGNSYNKMNDQPTTLVKAGDSWYEAPGCHHKVSDNASKTEKLVLIATFVIDTDVLEKEGQAALVQIDEKYRKGFEEAMKKQQQEQQVQAQEEEGDEYEEDNAEGEDEQAGRVEIPISNKRDAIGEAIKEAEKRGGDLKGHFQIGS